MFMNNMGHIMTLANGIIGVGILAMPFCFHKCGIILSILLLVLNYLVTRISCYYLIRSSLLARRRSFEFLGYYAFGSSGKLMVELCIIGYLIGTCIAYFVVVGDLGPRIVAKILNLDENDNLRTWVMILVTILCIIPLGLLRNVDSLSTVSTASIGFYICLVLKVISESEGHLFANDWYDKVVYWEPDGILQCLPIFSMACSCQMQLFEVMETVPNQTLEKMNSIVKQSTKICTSVYVMVGLFGYIGFCTIPFTGNILVHFSESVGSEVIKIGFVLSVAFSFPLVIFPCRVSIFSLIYKRGHGDASSYIPEKRFKVITICIVLISLTVALMIPSIELVIGLVGSTIGIAICVIFPALVYLKIFCNIRTFERTLAQVILICGFFLMILGTYANLSAIDEKRSIKSIDAAQIENLKQYEYRISNSVINKIAEKEIEKLLQPPIPHKKFTDSEEGNKFKLKLPFETSLILKTEKSKLPVEDNGKLPNIDLIKRSTQMPISIDNNMNLRHNDDVKQKPNQTTSNIRKENDQAEQIKKEIQSVVEQNLKANIKSISESNLESKKKEESQIKEIPLEKKIENITSNTNNIIDKDAIKKDEEIAAEEEDKNKDKKLEKAEAELKLAKDIIVKKVDELKQEIVKQNEETQKLVNEKLSDIIETVKEIKEEVHEEKKSEQKKEHENIQNDLTGSKESEKVKNLPEVDKMIKFKADKGSLVAQLSEKIKEAQKLSVNNNIISKIDSLTNNQKNEVIEEEPNKQNVPSKNLNEAKNSNDNENDKLPLEEKVYEPLSYKTGELLNKINESRTKLDEKRVPIPLPLLFNSTNNKIAEINNISSNNQTQNLLNKTKTNPVSNLNNEKKNISDNNALPKSKDLTESNIEAIRRDILEIKDVTTEKSSKLIREKRDLKDNFEYDLTFDNHTNDENCLPNCYPNEPVQKNKNLLISEFNNGFKTITGARDLKSIKED